MASIIDKFSSGATRDGDTNKYDYEGFLSPLVIERFGQYMHKCRLLSDGSLRDSDNWQKGIPLPRYMKSGWRHLKEWWSLHRGYPVKDDKGVDVDIEESICGLMFNAMGYLHEILKEKQLK